MTWTPRAVTSSAAAVTVLAVFVIPLCGALMAADLCPMIPSTQAMGVTTCHRAAEVGIEGRTVNCCLIATAESPKALPSVTLPALTPSWSSGLMPLPRQTQAVVCDRGAAPPPLDLRNLHSSLLL